jgi:NAD(P)-dependent dehydrogenase (short-subunit alcohol dehydrogenase family)
MNHKTIAGTGATGQQGGAVARKLLAAGWKVRALTRDITKPAAQELKSLGAELVAGDKPAMFNFFNRGWCAESRFTAKRRSLRLLDAPR